MNSAQRHRGPDDEGSFCDNAFELSLAMRRLSIVDIADGHQPMCDPTGNFVIVFNGEVFNAPELRAELESQGCVFRSDHSDTEVILHLYARDGARCTEQLNGMFAFAVFDRARRRLFLARDPLGIKPLFYWWDGSAFAFASELKSLLKLPRVSRDLDMDSLNFYLSLQYTPPERTIYSAIRKLAAGHTLTLNLARREPELAAYWFPPVATPYISSGHDEVIRELRRRLESAATAWTMSDVDVGVSLSGGIDSATIVGLLASRGHRLKTWTLGFDGDPSDGGDLDERQMARVVAERWKTEHHEIVVRPTALLDDLDSMVAQLDEPYGGGLPSWYVFREMSRDVKVALTGTGGDELFGNYGKWRRMQFPSAGWATRRIRSWQAHGVGQCLANPHGSLFKVQFGERDRRTLMRDVVPAQGVPTKLEQLWRECGARDPRSAVAYVDMRTQLPEEFLMMTDRFSMAWSIEARTPFLDRPLVEFVMGLPPKVRNPAGAGKATLIDAVRDLLPDALITGHKRGFVLPTAAWLRAELRPLLNHYLGRAFLERQGLFRSDLYDHMVRPHQAGRGDLSEKLWTLLMFQLWWQRNLGEPQ
jgi:asparagine synthase (glutamine-hydrolysing)